MNNRIKELAKLAGMVEYPTGINTKENTIWGDRNIQRFAELIVQECAKVSERTGALNEADYEGEMIASAIIEHFGVE